MKHYALMKNDIVEHIVITLSSLFDVQRRHPGYVVEPLSAVPQLALARYYAKASRAS